MDDKATIRRALRALRGEPEPPEPEPLTLIGPKRLRFMGSLGDLLAIHIDVPRKTPQYATYEFAPISDSAYPNLTPQIKMRVCSDTALIDDLVRYARDPMVYGRYLTHRDLGLATGYQNHPWDIGAWASERALIVDHYRLVDVGVDPSKHRYAADFYFRELSLGTGVVTVEDADGKA